MRNHKLITVLVLVLLGFIYIPLLWTSSQALDIKLMTDTFADSSFQGAFMRSLMLAVLSSLCAVMLSLVLIVKSKPSRWDKAEEKLMWLSLSMPEIILSLSLLSLFVLIDWPLGFFSTLVSHITLTLPFAFLVLKLQYQNMDLCLIEAAQDLGADPIKIFWMITLPTLKPSLLAALGLCFLLSLDDFLVTFFVSGSGYETLPLRIFSMMKIGLSPQLNVLSFLILTISFLILFIVYPKLQKWRSHGS